MVTQPGPPGADSSRPAPSVPPAGRAARRRASRTWWRAVALSALAAGLARLAVSASAVSSQVLPRRFTPAQQRAIEAWDVGQRWRSLPAGSIFPASVTYRLPGAALYDDRDLRLSAKRLGMSPAASCAHGASRGAATVLARYGCAAVLRATYTDATGSMVATVGVAVVRDSAAALAAATRLDSAAGSRQPATVRAVPVPGTLASRFTDSQRQLSWDTHAGPYVILTTVGYTDGQPTVRVAADHYLDQEMRSLAQGLGGAASAVLGKAPPIPHCPGAPGC